MDRSLVSPAPYRPRWPRNDGAFGRDGHGETNWSPGAPSGALSATIGYQARRHPGRVRTYKRCRYGPLPWHAPMPQRRVWSHPAISKRSARSSRYRHRRGDKTGFTPGSVDTNVHVRAPQPVRPPVPSCSYAPTQTVFPSAEIDTDEPK